MGFPIFRRGPSENDRQALVELLRRCEALVSASDDSDWSYMAVREIGAALNAAVEELERGKVPDKHELTLLFAPTGALQETSMSNGWADDYLALSSKFDQLIARWH